MELEKNVVDLYSFPSGHIYTDGVKAANHVAP